MEAKMAHDLIVAACLQVESDRSAELKNRLAIQYEAAYGASLRASQ